MVRKLVSYKVRDSMNSEIERVRGGGTTVGFVVVI